MTQRTRDKTWTFRNPFSLKGVDHLLPAGNYRVSTDEEMIESLSFPVYRRIATMIFVPVPVPSILVVALFGTGPGLYFDFATFSFQTPTCGSLCAKAASMRKRDNPRHTTDETMARMVSLI